MWCSHCNKETTSVPTRTADGICCALCGEAYFQEKPTEDAIRQARDIIARWSSSDLLDQISTLPEIPPLNQQRTENSDSATGSAETAERSEIERTEDVVPAASVREKKMQDGSDHPAVPGTAEESDAQTPEEISQISLETAPPEEPRPHEVVASISKPTTNEASASAQNDNSDTKPAERDDAVGSSPDSAEPPQVQAGTSVSKPSKPKRTSQARATQTRVQRPRKQAPSVKDEGTKSMSRKFRIDTPGGEQAGEPASESRNVAGARIQSNSTSGKRHRIDSGTPVAETLDTGDKRSRTQGRPRRRYIDEAHDSVARGPHFEVTAPRRSNFTSITGQFLAYIGVLGLTVGTAMVIYGHFGGYSEYTPTGWLVTTVAQMMLFLGVINLVSGGMEQTNSDVSQRMEHLGSQLMRIEQVAEEALRGPKISARRYADPDAEYADTEREQALAED